MRSRAEFDDSARPDEPTVGVERVRHAGGGRLVTTVGVGVVIMIGLALLKPWGERQAPPAIAASDRPAATWPLVSITPAPPRTPRPTPTMDSATRAALERRQCQSGDGWRIVTVENNAIGHSRTLWIVDALSPTPERAVTRARRLWAERTLGIGYCAPGRSVDERGARAGDVSLWLASKGSAPVRVEPGEILDPPLGDLGEVYFAPPDQLALKGSWPAGVYLFQVLPGSAADASAAGWFALDVRRVRPR